MKKAIGILCVLIFLASLGWKLTQLGLDIGNTDFVDVGYLQVSDGSVLQFKDGEIITISGTGFSVGNPVVYKVNDAIYIAASVTCLLAAIALLKKDKA